MQKYMLIVVTTSLLIEAIGTCYQVIQDVRSNGRPERGTYLWAAVLAVSLFAGGMFSTNLPSPDIRVSDDRTGVVLSSPALWESIEYFMSEDESDEIEWSSCESEQMLTIEKDPTFVWYRGTYLGLNSEPQRKTAHIDEYGRVYFDDPPEVTFESLMVQYLARGPEDGRAGNTYAGYRPKNRDFSVKGESPNGELVDVKGFAYNVDVLKEGENTIKVAYVTSSGQKLEEKVTVSVGPPQLISLDARLEPEAAGRVEVGSELDASMFEVIGLYEGGDRQSLESFELDPVKMPDEPGVQTVMVRSGSVSCALKVDVYDPMGVVGQETEPNGSFADADVVDLDARYSGRISGREDEDFFRFRLKKKSKVSITFEHEKIDSGESYWSVELLPDASNDPVIRLDPTGSVTVTQSPAARLSPGTYFVKVAHGWSESETDYTFCVNHTEEDDSAELEPNDEISSAYEIVPGAVYWGNLTDSADYDYYKLSLKEKTKFQLAFGHEKTDQGDSCWEVKLLDDSGGETLLVSSSGKEKEVVSDALRLPAGEYYIRVKPAWHWLNDDYWLRAECVPEGEGSESEPNGDYKQASRLALGLDMMGNIQDSGDVDFFMFDYGGDGWLRLSFLHTKLEDGTSLWEASLFGDNPAEPIADTEGRKQLMVCGNDPEEVTCDWSGLAAGTYYIRVSRGSRHDASDYHLLVSG